MRLVPCACVAGAITGFTPPSSPYTGTFPITIQGTNMADATVSDVTSVDFLINGVTTNVPAGSLTSHSATSIVLDPPDSAFSTATVVVHSVSQGVISASFTYHPST